MTKYFYRIATIFCLCALVTSPALGAWAIALGPSGDPIVSRGYGAVFDAKRGALKDCNELFGNCEIVASANASCAALALAGHKWAVGKDAREQTAHDNALAACAALNAGPCKVMHEFCGI